MAATLEELEVQIQELAARLAQFAPAIDKMLSITEKTSAMVSSHVGRIAILEASIPVIEEVDQQVKALTKSPKLSLWSRLFPSRREA